MSTLASSIKRPARFVSPIDRVKVMQEGSDEEQKVVRERLSLWKAFSQTRSGVIVRELADPVMKFLTGEICKSVTDFPDWSADKIRDHKNMLTGELRVWEDIVYNIDVLERRLAEITELEKKEEAEEEKIPEAVQKHM